MGARWRGARARALTVGVAVLVGAVALPAAPAAGVPAQGDPPAPPPVITVTPATGLAVGDTVTVSGSGFPSPSLSTPVQVALCSTAPVADLEEGFIAPDRVEPSCAAGRSAYTAADGTFAVELPVTTARAAIVWAGTSAVTHPLRMDVHARVATAPVQVAPPAGDRVAVTVDRAERYARHGVTVRAIFEGALPEPGSAGVAECSAEVLEAPADPVVVAATCDGESTVPVTPDEVGEVVATMPASPGTGAMRAGGRSPSGAMLGGAAPITVYDPHVTITPHTGLVEAQAVRVQVDDLGIPTDTTWSGWNVYQCDRAVLADLPMAYLHDRDCTRGVAVGEPGPGGLLDAEYTVHRYIEVSRGSDGQRTIDCAAAREACVLLVAGQVQDDARAVGFAAPVDVAPAPPVVAALHAGAVTEGDAGTVTGHVPVVLNRPVAHPVTVTYRTFDNFYVPWAARSNEDYRPAEGTVTLAAGETTGSIPVEVVGDTRPEPAEMALVGIWEVTGAVRGGYGGIGGIQVTDDD